MRAKDFPCTYLFLPLALRKPTKSDLLLLIDKVVDNLPGWKTSLMNKAGRLIIVRVVLSTIPIYLMIAMDLPKWVLKATDKKRRGFFLCKGRENANGVTILCHGKRFNALFSLGDLAFITLKIWDGHSVSNGCGHQRQMMRSVFAKVWLCKFHLMLKCSLTLPSRR